jgi:3-oxoacyl-[acyl-carrier protein] reductase
MSAKKAPVVLVTGASRGLGQGIALQLAASGYSVAVNYTKNETAANETVSKCQKLQIDDYQKFIPFKADIGKKEDRDNLVDKVISAFDRLDALVNNAGIAPHVRADILEADENSFEEIMKINLQGPHFLTQSVVKYWQKEQPQPLLKTGFAVIFITSISAYTASVNRGDYCISKAGLSMSSKLWATRLAGEGIQVLELRPGIMFTDMTSGVKDKYDKLIEEGLVPQKRWGTTNDLGLAVSSILSGNFPYSSGAIIDIDGGFNLQRL